MARIEVAKSDEVGEGALHAVKAEGVSVLLSRVGGEVRAIENRCPHLGLPMTRGQVADGRIRCPWHGSSFDLCTGANLDWVNAVGGMPLPDWSRGMVALGRKPAPVRTFAVAEEAGKVFLILP